MLYFESKFHNIVEYQILEHKKSWHILLLTRNWERRGVRAPCTIFLKTVLSEILEHTTCDHVHGEGWGEQEQETV